MSVIRVKAILSLTLAGVLAGSLAMAQEKPRKQVLTSDEYVQVSHHSLPYILEWHTGKGGLLYYGATNNFDPTDPEIARMERLWRGFHPDIAFFERSDLAKQTPIGPADTRAEAISRFGEPGLTVFLALRYGVPTRPLEVSQADEVRLLAEQRYPAELIKIFYVLRKIPEFRKQQEDDSAIEKYVETELYVLSGIAGLRGAPNSLPEFEAEVARFLPKLKNWRHVPSYWFDPTSTKSNTILNSIARRIIELRDEHMAKVLIDEVKRGRWVFAVAGANHVVIQERALRAAFEAK